MKITQRQLKRIIKEEIQTILLEANAITFYQLVDMAKPGDVLRLKFNKNVHDTGMLVFKAGKTYRGTVKPGSVVIFHEKIFLKGSKSTITKAELKAKIRKKGDPCTTMNCTVSTVTRSGISAPISAIMANPSIMAPKQQVRTKTKTKTKTKPSVGCKSDTECKSKCGNISSCKCIKMSVGPDQCINTGGAGRAPAEETEKAPLPEGIVLRYGSGYRSRGKAAQRPDVKKLQSKLIILKHMAPTRTNRRGKTVSSIDGFYGVATKKAVVAFQRSKKGLDVDGVAGENTLKALNTARFA